MFKEIITALHEWNNGALIFAYLPTLLLLVVTSILPLIIWGQYKTCSEKREREREREQRDVWVSRKPWHGDPGLKALEVPFSCSLANSRERESR